MCVRPWKRRAVSGSTPAVMKPRPWPLIERERIDLVLVAWDAFHDGLELLHALRRMPEHR